MLSRRDEAALEILYDRHGDHVFSLAYRMLGTRGPAEEVVRLAFQTAWSERAARVPDGGDVRGRLLRITHDKAVDVLRGRVSPGRPSRRPAGPAEAEPAVDELARRRLAKRPGAPELLPALARIRPEQARVIELAYFGGYGLQEIAAILEVPAETVRSRMRMALEHLDRTLTQGGG